MKTLQIVLMLACCPAVALGDSIILDLSKSAQSVTATLDEADPNTVRASVQPGDSFPIHNSQWRGAGEVVGQGADQIYYKEWKGRLDEIKPGETVVIVYQQPQRLTNIYGQDRFELADMKIATDFKLVKKSKSVQLQVLTWYQLPSGSRKKLTVHMANREERTLSRRLALAEQAQVNLPNLRANLEAMRSQARSGGTTDNPRAGRAAFFVQGAARNVAKAESLVREIPHLKESLAIVPGLSEFGEQLHDRAGFEVEFTAGAMRLRSD